MENFLINLFLYVHISAEEISMLKARVHIFKHQLQTAQNELQTAQNELKKKDVPKRENATQTDFPEEPSFSTKKVLEKERKKDLLFKMYTGIKYTRFCVLLSFLLSGQPFKYTENRKELKDLKDEDGLFFTLCRLRLNFPLNDLAFRFNLSQQTAGVIFDSWLQVMYLKLGSLGLWPHRDVVLKNSPPKCQVEYPNTLVLLDATELKTEVPWKHVTQSQMYSKYKSSTTCKGLVGCGPSGDLMFVSKLFTGSISDKSICEESGLYNLISDMKKVGYIQSGDSVMADKGFTIESELKELGLGLNIPPFVVSTAQMTEDESNETAKIATHRIHIERLISRIKNFKILKNRISMHLLPKLDYIWTVCSVLTTFQDFLISDK